MNRELHEHQKLAEALLRESLRSGHRRPIIQSPTGSGKTVLAAAIVEKALAKGKRVIFTVPKLSLIDQTVERFNEEGIQGDRRDSGLSSWNGRNSAGTGGQHPNAPASTTSRGRFGFGRRGP
jgi:superfamily II DNA or RNA helicase